MSDGSTNTYLHEISEQDSYMYIHADMLHTNVTYSMLSDDNHARRLLRIEIVES